MISDLSKHWLLLLLIVASIGPGGVLATDAAAQQDENTMEASHNANSSQVQCKQSEILTTEWGCLDRFYVVRSALQYQWRQAFKKSKCPNNQKLVEGSCTGGSEHELPQVAPKRVPVEPSYLHNGKFYRSQAEVPKTNPENSNAVVGVGTGGHTEDASTGSRMTDISEEDVGEKGEVQSSSKRVIGHNRPRKYELMPGRLLKTYRKCRPYEVMGVKNRCIRKKGKVGFYKHKNHVYGSPKRDRQSSLEDQQQQLDILSSMNLISPQKK